MKQDILASSGMLAQDRTPITQAPSCDRIKEILPTYGQ